MQLSEQFGLGRSETGQKGVRGFRGVRDPWRPTGLKFSSTSASVPANQHFATDEFGRANRNRARILLEVADLPASPLGCRFRVGHAYLFRAFPIKRTCSERENPAEGTFGYLAPRKAGHARQNSRQFLSHAANTAPTDLARPGSKAAEFGVAYNSSPMSSSP